MKILLIHNYYRYRGGEDIAFDELKAMLSGKGMDLKVYTRNSASIKGPFRKFLSIFSLFYSFKAAKDIAGIVSGFKPDVAHIHNLFPLISVSILNVLKKCNIPIIQTIHNYRFFCANGLCLDKGKVCEDCLDLKISNILKDCKPENRFYNYLMLLNLFIIRRKNSFKLIDRFITPGRFIKKKMIEAGVESSKISIVKNIIKLPGAVQKSGKGKEPYFLYIGRISREKGIDKLVRMFGVLHGVRLKVLGDGPLLEGIKREIKEKNFNNIDIMGYIDGREKNKILGSAAAVIIPSICYEVSPLVIMESFKSGVPAIVNNIGSLPENTIEGQNGFIYDNQDDLKAKIKQLIQMTDEKRKEISQYARDHYDKVFDPEVNLNMLVKVYGEVTNNG
jgi:glycosyltransferase involved in cell wall biosynthesis